MMSDRIEGAAKTGVGRIQDGLGGLTGDTALQARGKINEAAGALQGAYDKVRDQALATADAAADQAAARAKAAYADVEKFVRAKPLLSVAIGAGVGVLFAATMGGRRREPKPRRH
jgi:uncharacterized protein YjbJ (UPF0337 family)